MSLPNKQTDKLLQTFSQAGKNPYVFSLSKPYPAEPPKTEVRLPHEEEILREQRLTFFEYDESTRRMFKDDFEAYNQAMDNPELMLAKLEEKLHALEQEISAVEADLPAWWQDEFWGDEFIEDDELMSLDFEPNENASDNAAVAGEWVPEWQDDPLYQKANKWAHRLFSVGQKLYEESSQKDPDLFRVLVNIFLVPAKIVYASSIGDDEFNESDSEATKTEAEISLHGYTLCSIFLRRVRESLARLSEKNLAPVGEWRAALLAADELLLEVQGRMIELAKRLRDV